MVNGPRGNQFHLDPATYLGRSRAEVPAYDERQDAVAEATADIQAERVLELGVGTGRDVPAGARPPPRGGTGRHRRECGHARGRVSRRDAADLRVSRLQDPLPDGNFDLVVSALAVHHLEGCR